MPFNQPTSKFYAYLFAIAGVVAVVGIIIFGDVTKVASKMHRVKNAKCGSYHVSILLHEKHHCTGTIIGRKHVLTAASCVMNNNITHSVSSVAIRITGYKKERIFKVARIYPHDYYAYSFGNRKYDIAVIRLKVAAPLTKRVRCMELPESKTWLSDGQILKVIGFHRGMFDELRSKDFKNFSISVVGEENCGKYFDEPDLELSGKFCAFLRPDHNSCLRIDGGSPVTVNDEYIVGVFSRVHYCITGKERPHFCNHVSDHLSFIRTAMKRIK